jgi:hypothetical protein
MRRKKDALDDEELQTAIDNLVEVGCDKRQMTAFGILLLNWDDGLEQGARDVFQSLDQFRELNEGVRKLDEAVKFLKHVNSYPLLGTNGLRLAWGINDKNNRSDTGSSLTQEQRKQLESIRTLERLPDLINHFARLLRLQTAVTEKQFRYGGKLAGRKRIKWLMLQYVENQTGSQCYDLVSKFIDAFAYASGRYNKAVQQEFTPAALQNFRSRYRRHLNQINQLLADFLHSDAK